MGFQHWILTEDINITVVNNEDDQPELLVERVFGPGAVLLKMRSVGRILSNGQDIDLGDDTPAYWGIFDHVMDSHPTEKAGDDMANWPPVGFTCEMSADPATGTVPSANRSAVRAVVSAILSATDDCWKPQDAENVIVNVDGTWCSPGTFDSIYGTWQKKYSTMIVAVNTED